MIPKAWQIEIRLSLTEIREAVPSAAVAASCRTKEILQLEEGRPVREELGL